MRRHTPCLGIAILALVAGCSSSSATRSPSADGGAHDAGGKKKGAPDAHTAGDSGVDATMRTGTPDAAHIPDVGLPEVNRPEAPPPSKVDYCSLPGAVVWQNGAPKVVPGGAAGAPDLTWMKLPDGFCSHYFATVPETRNMRFSPSGDLFVASPGRPAAGGAPAGLSAVVVLPDDNHDGVADSTLKFLTGLVTTHGLLFYGGSLFYQNGPVIYKTPYANGQRAATGVGEPVVNVNVYASPVHWAKALDADDNGNIYVTNGGDDGQACTGAELTSDPPFTGGILRIDGSENGEPIAKGLRNAYTLRCAKGTGQCFALELALDFAPGLGSREKLIPVRKGDNWGFPCCATANTPYANYTDPAPDCSGVSAEEDSFVIDHTPFGLDFEEGGWSGTFEFRAFVALHGYFVSWYGARIVAISTDPKTGWPETAKETDAGTTTMMDFATGWDDGKQDHGRPAAIAFAPDGRLFIGDDMNGLIVWVDQVQAATK